MRVLVAGGAGFIGSHLCDYLIARGHEVICVDNLLTGRRQNVLHLLPHPLFRFVKADVTKAVPVCRSVDVVFHLASPASPKDYFSLPLETLAAGSQGTRNLLEICRKKKATFVLASTSEVYGDPLVHPQSEDYWGNVNPVGVRSVYDEAKRFAEALTMAYHRRYGMPTRIARIFNTYGPRMKLDDGRVVPNFIRQALNDEPLTVYGSGRQTRSFCFVSDMVEGLYRLISCSDSQPVNLGNPCEFSILQLVRIVRKLTGCKSRVRFLPRLSDDPRRRKPDISKAAKLLGWKPLIDIEEGLRITVSWFRHPTAEPLSNMHPSTSRLGPD